MLFFLSIKWLDNAFYCLLWNWYVSVCCKLYDTFKCASINFFFFRNYIFKLKNRTRVIFCTISYYRYTERIGLDFTNNDATCCFSIHIFNFKSSILKINFHYSCSNQFNGISVVDNKKIYSEIYFLCILIREVTCPG